MAIFLILLVQGCDGRYKRIDGTIAWVHWNTGSGKVVDVLEVSDPLKVIILSDEYAKDDEKVFWKHLVIKGADPSSFVLLHAEYSYSADKQSVYFQNRKIPGTQPGEFKPLDYNYGVSMKNVFYRTHTINGADPATFVISEFESSAVYGCYLVADFLGGCKEVYER